MTRRNPPVVLTIGGSDSSGATGIQSDLKTFAAHRAYGMSVLTAITAQNGRGVKDVFPLPGNVVSAQLAAVLDEITPAAIKVGMMATADIASVITAKARAGALPNLVLDPVLISPDGRRRGVVGAIERLLPYATIITPNIDEASALVGWEVVTQADMAGAASQLASRGPQYVVITGGRMPGSQESVDAVWTANGTRFLRAPRLETANRRGVGCAFAAALAAQLAIGCPVPEALTAAKNYASRGLAGARHWKIASGPGPIDQFGWTAEDLFA